mgnify:CR=1 FL=1
MKKKTIFKFTTITAFLFIVAGMIFFNPINSFSCGYGTPGGSDLVPKGRLLISETSRPATRQQMP